MSIRKLIFLLVLFMPLVTLAQGETNNWYFGFNAGITFNNDGTVSPLADGALNSYEGCAAISSANGELLFYTDGQTVYARNHTIMVNGTGLLGNPESTQSAVIVAVPEADNLYYIFTIDTTIGGVRGEGFNYSVVDMSLNSGNGEIIQKNTNLLPDCADKVAAVIKDCNANSFWVVTLSTETGAKTIPPATPIFNTFHAFEVGPAGINPTAVRSTFTDLLAWDQRGYLKFSLDGTKLASANVASGLYIYDFDVATGIASNQEEITITATNIFSYGIEFSPNGQYLYVHASNNRAAFTGHESSLLQYDIFDPGGISGSQVILEERSLYRGALQMGVNGKIYRALSTSYIDGSPYLGVIHNPDEKGLAANYEHNAVPLNNTSAQGLPSLVTSFFNSVDLVEDTNSDLLLCEGDALTLEAQLIAGATYEWRKDGIPFVNASNTYTVPVSAQEDSGTYTVSIVRPGAALCPIIAETIVDVAPLPESTTLNGSHCDTEDADATDGIAVIDITQVEDNAGLTYSYYLSEVDRDSDTPLPNPESFTNSDAFSQTLYYKTVNANGCEGQGLVELIVHPVPESIIDESFNLCVGDALMLEAQLIAGATYEWVKDGIPFVNTSNVYTVPASTQEDSGTYVVTILRAGVIDCPIIRETVVEVATVPESATLNWSHCDTEDADATDGIAVIDITQVEDSAGLTYSYYLSEADRDSDTPIQNPESFTNNDAFFQTLWYKTVNANDCETQGIVELDVHPVPESIIDESFNLCEGDTLTLEAELIAGATYEWTKDGTPFVNTSNVYTVPVGTRQDAGTYVVTILRADVVDCPIIGETIVEVAPLPESTTLNWYQCDLEDTDATDGIAVIDITQIENNVELTYSYYLSEADRDSDTQIQNPQNFVNNESVFQTLWYTAVNANGCEAQGIVELNIYPVPELVMEESYLFCEGDTGSQILSPVGFDRYNWYIMEGDAEVLVSTAEVLENVVNDGTYILEGVQINGAEDSELGCTRRFTFEVEISRPAEIVEVNIADSNGINTVEVVATGTGDYEYSVDGITYQNSNYLENIPSEGSLTVYVRDKKGCGIVERTVEIGVSEKEFPKFFSPNGDGINDKWNYQPSDVNKEVDISHINIYNRYGRLLVQLDPLGPGWDGTVNGDVQPQADYWYQVISSREREIRGHFSLIFR